MYSRKKGKSGSIKPVKKTKPIWVIHSPEETEQLVIKLAKSGLSMSQMGLVLRDTYGIPDVKIITKKNISKILEENKLNKELPEDLSFLIKRAITLNKHLTANKKDMVAKRGMQLTEAKIRRLTKYYKKKGRLANDWNYNIKRAKILVE